MARATRPSRESAKNSDSNRACRIVQVARRAFQSGQIRRSSRTADLRRFKSGKDVNAAAMPTLAKPTMREFFVADRI